MADEQNTPNDAAHEGADENRLIAERRAKLNEWRESGEAFPNHFRRDSLAADLQKQYGELSKEELEEKNIQVAVAGRLMLDRKAFKVLQDMSGRIQIFAPKPVQKDTKHWDLGDVVGVRGTLCKSGMGDLYVMMDEYLLLTKSLRPLPEKHKGLTDTESRYRQRYVDLIVNEDSRRTFQIRSQMVAGIRNYLVRHGFVEAETPMLQVIPGGATARPFITHHNSLDLDMYLRIAPELYLKRLVVGGFERVFEINRNFRNEGLSTRHNPEFTMLEFYQAYADHNDLMNLTEDMLRTLAQDVLGTTEIPYQDDVYDFGKPFARLSVFDSILQYNDDIDAATLARRKDDDPFVTERFEFFVGGREIANGFSELNDAEDQAERFRAQVAEKEAGDDEAMFYDEDYITALEHGLPPTAGEGIGIDRLVMLFTNSPSIRDVILFPHMRPR